MIFCVRTDESVPKLERWLDRQRSGAVVDRTIGPLNVEAVQAFVESLQLPDVNAPLIEHLAADITRHVGGHPFLMLELLRARSASDEAATGRTLTGAGHLLQTLGRRIAC